MRTVIAAAVAAAALLLPVPAGASAASVPECRSSNLHASFANDGGAAASHTYGHLRLRNVSKHDCFVQGYGGLSFVGHGNGTQLGAAADRTPSRTPRVVLRPGQRVVSLVAITSPYPYPRSTCQRAWADGFRVYVPDSRFAKFVPFRTLTCANPRLHMLAHKAYRRP